MKQSYRALAIALTCVVAAGLFAGCASTGGGSNPFVGTWTLTVESALGTSEQTLTIASDLSATLDVPDVGALEIPVVATDGNSATFDITFDIQGQELAAVFEGTVEGDSITAEYVTELGNGTITGTRAQ